MLTYWHRPLHAMTDAFTADGFRISVISEPPPPPPPPDPDTPPEPNMLGDLRQRGGVASGKVKVLRWTVEELMRPECITSG